MQDNYLNLEIKRTLSNIENYINKLESNEYYSKNNEIYLAIHKKFINCLIRNLDKIPTFLYQELLKHLNYVFIPILRYIQRSQTKDIPWSLIPNIEKIINDLLGNNFIILVRPKWHWDYSVIVHDRSSYLKNIVLFFTKNKNLLKIKEKTHVISFPFLEKTNFLLHTIFGHEIGHFFQQIYFTKYLTKNWREKKINKLLELLKKEQETERPYKVEEIMNIYQGMVREILPDIIGYFLLGPSMLFVLYYFSYWNDDICKPNTENNYYPPLKYRIRILQELLDNDMKGSTKKEKLFLKFNTEIKSYLKDQSDLSLLNSHNLFKYAFDMFENEENKSNIINFCKKILKNRIYNFDAVKIEKLIKDRIKKTIPPNEYKKKPVELGDIFLSGWIYYYDLLKEKETLKKDEYVNKHVNLDRLLLKASNSIYIHSYYLDHKKCLH